ncbi:hypothetical protein BDV95DRAFT_596753 [Massariosphaeria phaeospora]|uniref:Uncharacterized protein n=1 Tax=Massariosphaeria phaeospora TaxID=100035 RepID=A0A7C8I4C2_9PLEO|nr:hypothetical protein BDV95DRAFT_596753 [Massariosphaeria phaeospora]
MGLSSLQDDAIQRAAFLVKGLIAIVNGRSAELSSSYWQTRCKGRRAPVYGTLGSVYICTMSSDSRDHTIRTDEELEAEYDMMSREEADEYYDIRGLPRLSKDERTHQEWLRKRLCLKKDRIIIEFGLHRIYYEFRLDEIPKTSAVLMQLGKRPFVDRSIWLKNLNVEMIRTYLFPQEMYPMAIQYSWIRIMQFAYTAIVLQDPVLEAHAYAVMRCRAKLAHHQGSQMFQQDVVEWVYENSEPGSEFRKIVVDLAVGSKALVTAFTGPAEFLTDVKDLLDKMKDEGIELPHSEDPDSTPGSPRSDTSWFDVNDVWEATPTILDVAFSPPPSPHLTPAPAPPTAVEQALEQLPPTTSSATRSPKLPPVALKKFSLDRERHSSFISLADNTSSRKSNATPRRKRLLHHRQAAAKAPDVGSPGPDVDAVRPAHLLFAQSRAAKPAEDVREKPVRQPRGPAAPAEDLARGARGNFAWRERVQC